MADVFISYRSNEYVHANRVRSALMFNGISCWMAPESIGIGSDYASEIPKAISQCRIFVLLLSQGAQESEWVPKELDKAISCKRVIMPFMIERCRLNNRFSFCLSNIQILDGYIKNQDAAVQELVDRIRFVLNPIHQDSHSSQPREPRPQPKPPVDPNPKILVEQIENYKFSKPFKESPLSVVLLNTLYIILMVSRIGTFAEYNMESSRFGALISFFSLYFIAALVLVTLVVVDYNKYSALVKSNAHHVEIEAAKAKSKKMNRVFHWIAAIGFILFCGFYAAL